MLKRAVILGLLLLGGCGFHLRGSLELPEHLTPIYINESKGGTDAAFVLRQNLIRNDLAVVDNANAAETVITVYEESFDRQTGAVGPDGKALEYRLIYSAAISAENAAGETLLERQTLATERSQSYDESAVTGLSNEESQLRSEMALDVAGQFLRRLQALGRAGQ